MDGPIAVATVFGSVIALTALLRLRYYAFAWGATADDVHHDWPGDALSPDSATVATRAIAIDAPASVVWAYVVQIGQDRAGFYSYTWLENLFRCRMPNVSRIVPEWRSRIVGDNVWLAHRDHYNGNARLKVARIDDGKDLVLVSPEDWGRVTRREHALDGSWTLIVVPTSPAACKLIVRSRGPAEPGVFRAIVRAAVFDPAHFIMERRMMRHIKALAEAGARQS
jgi:hypothetical protein